MVAPLGAGPTGLLDIAVAVAQGANPPAPEIGVAARAAAPLLTSIAPAQMRTAIEAVILGRSMDVGLQWMHDCGMLGVVLPELEATVDFSQEAGRRHKDVWEHTKQVVRQAVPRLEVRWAALFHDIGKVKTRSISPDGKVHFHRHSEVGARMFEDISRRFRFERETSRIYLPMAKSGMDISLPYISSAPVLIGTILPVDLDMRCRPSVPGKIPVMTPTSGFCPRASCSLRPATMMLNNWSVPPTWTSVC